MHILLGLMLLVICGACSNDPKPEPGDTEKSFVLKYKNVTVYGDVTDKKSVDEKFKAELALKLGNVRK